MGSEALPKVCFAASSGGHFEQLMMLKPLMEKFHGFVVTEQTAYLQDTGFQMYLLKQVNRKERSCIPRMVINAWRSLKIMVKERPDVIVCTGVLATVPLCLIGKLAGKKLVYIESFAKVTTPTKTGKLLYRWADRFYVQWDSMLEVYPDAVYAGGVY